MKRVIIDAGHGVNTAGKRSPDGRLVEGVYAREMAKRVGEALGEAGIPYSILVPEIDDVPLKTRVSRANQIHRETKDGTILVSLHSDAVSSRGWHDARGMSVRVALNASQNSKTLARCFYSAWESRGLRTRKWNNNISPWWPQNLAICRDTKMPAVLVEMFFHDNESDVSWALSSVGKEMLTGAIAEGIRRFLNA